VPLREGCEDPRHFVAQFRWSKDLDLLAQAKKFSHADLVGFDRQPAANPTAAIRRTCRSRGRLHDGRAERFESRETLLRQTYMRGLVVEPGFAVA
jgi:hypothetical protein